MRARNIFELAFVIAHLEVRELQPVRRANDDGSVTRANRAFVDQLLQHRECHACVRTGEHPGQVCMSSRVRKLLFRSLLDDAVRLLNSFDSFCVAHRTKANINLLRCVALPIKHTNDSSRKVHTRYKHSLFTYVIKYSDD